MVLVEMVKSESLKIKDNEKEIHHRRNEERGQGTPLKEQNWPNKEQNRRGKELKWKL